MGKIKVLDEKIASIIAAGEVVVRPSNVVKELVENSLDAGATRINIKITKGGKEEIHVFDNGCGMDEDDALLAFTAHATSKIHKIQDLFSISTMGFRGEALPSIAAISNLEIVTAIENENPIKLILQAGNLVSKEICAGEKGTSIKVKDLFFNTPARFKYLKNDYVENANTINFCEKLALSYPSVAFSLTIDDKMIFQTSGNGDLSAVIATIYGINIAKSMIKIDCSNYDYKITGFIASPTISKSNRSFMTTFINNRLVRVLSLQSAIIEGYRNALPPDRYPVVILNIEIDPKLVDVNVHPTKMEVKIAPERELSNFIATSIEQTLTGLSSNANQPVETYKSHTTNNFRQDNSAYFRPYHSEEVSFINTENTIEKDNLFTIAEQALPLDMQVIGALAQSYIIAQNQQGYYIIDKHAASERINYEKYSVLLGEKSSSIAPLLTQVIDLSKQEFMRFTASLEQLSELGLVFEIFGQSSVRLVEHPQWMCEVNIENYCEQIVSLVCLDEKIDILKLRKGLIDLISCHSSVRSGDQLTLSQMQTLIDNLFKCQHPTTCPHGRPIMLEFSLKDLEKTFKRTGF